MNRGRRVVQCRVSNDVVGDAYEALKPYHLSINIGMKNRSTHKRRETAAEAQDTTCGGTSKRTLRADLVLLIRQSRHKVRMDDESPRRGSDVIEWVTGDKCEFGPRLNVQNANGVGRHNLG